MSKSFVSISTAALTILHLFISGVESSTTFTISNKCDHTVWPGILSNAGIASLSTTGFSLQKGETRTLTAPSKWGGRFWGRTLCSTDSSTGKFTCITGDCNSGKLECSGNNALPPATLAEFTLNGSGGLDFFDVSFVDGYNLPMLIMPQGGTGENCTSTGCAVDLNGVCPAQLKVSTTTDTVSANSTVVACKSACEALKEDQYCCSGAYATPDTCKPSSYSEVFKRACPQAYSYAYDDKTSTFTCSGADYLITFCPSSSTSQKSSEGQNPVSMSSPAMDNPMVYEGALAMSGESSPSTRRHVFRSAGAATIVGATWWLRRLF